MERMKESFHISVLWNPASSVLLEMLDPKDHMCYMLFKKQIGKDTEEAIV